ncbi:hypothetical protein AGLY_015279 [Aphis glycines]|uniref:ubiquitinyl hydrolase 1 n=1 Tax=Aphis glycines TaxID=307491 RepID=A0A6G0T0R5_APHGL|nr:hypothetical protein AGLY_015279 [Aphis glycines]
MYKIGILADLIRRTTLASKHVFLVKVSELEIREINSFCGLKNLGAICYINSLLQLWFYNLQVRNTILRWNPMEDETEKHNPTLFIENRYEPTTSVGQSQLIFALMLKEKQKTINPEAFIKSLKIDIRIEQDSEELSNKNGGKQSLLGGYQSIITICLTCNTESASHSIFRHLNLSIECHKTLDDSLKDYFKEEFLAGDDQYYCDQCEGKQNATCKMYLNKLPKEVTNNCVNKDGIISLHWLKYLIKVNPNKIVKKIDNNAILCKHNLLNPDKVSSVKYIGSDLADKLYGIFQGGPKLKLMLSLCKICVRNKCALIYTNYLNLKQNESMTTILDNWYQTDDTNSKNRETSYWVDNETIKFWHKKYFKSFKAFLNTNDVLPNMILPINYETLSAECEPYSSLCKQIIVNGDMKQENVHMAIDAENMIKLGYNNNCSGKSNTEAEDYDLQNMNNTEHIRPLKFNSDIICKHGNMTIEKHSKKLVPKEVIGIFQTKFLLNFWKLSGTLSELH